MSTEKNLLNLIEESGKKFDLQTEVMIKVEVYDEKTDSTTIEEAPIKIDKIFSPTKVKKCVYEYISNVTKMKSKYSQDDDYVGVLEPYLIFMLVKHFSSLGKDIPQDIPTQIALMQNMIDSSALFQIMIKFDEDEITKIKEEIEIALAVFNANLEEVEGKVKSMRHLIKNQDMLGI